MSRSPRSDGKAANLDLVREADMTVEVGRPIDPPLPERMAYGGTYRLRQLLGEDHGRELFSRQQQPSQQIQVHYQVFFDLPMLRDLEHRAANNKSGNAVRGPATARAGGKAEVDISPRLLAGYVRRAANNENHRMSDGPVKIRVRLTEQPQGSPAVCANCHKLLADHDVVSGTEKGMWVGGRTRDAHYDPDFERVEEYYLCPLEAKP